MPRSHVERTLLGELGNVTRWARQHSDPAKRAEYAAQAEALRPKLRAARARRKAAEARALAEKYDSWAEAAERGHGLRHSLAFDLAQRGVPTHVIQAQLGHSSLAVTDRYVRHLLPSDVIETMREREW
jgi:integrase